MRIERELKEWFFNILDNCYVVKHDDYKEDIYLYYDEQFIRQKKLSRIIGKEMVYPKKPIGKCLFEIDRKNNELWVDYNMIWFILEEETGYNYQEIKEMLKDWLEEREKLSVLTPNILLSEDSVQFGEQDKLKVFTPGMSYLSS